MFSMTATKMLSYNNRRLVPGEDFEAKSQRDMRVLVASRKAKMKRKEVELAPPPQTLATKISAIVVPPNDPNPPLTPPNDPNPPAPPQIDEWAAARAAYKEKFDKQPYYGWDVATIREKIEAAAETT